MKKLISIFVVNLIFFQPIHAMTISEEGLFSFSRVLGSRFFGARFTDEDFKNPKVIDEKISGGLIITTYKHFQNSYDLDGREYAALNQGSKPSIKNTDPGRVYFLDKETGLHKWRVRSRTVGEYKVWTHKKIINRPQYIDSETIGGIPFGLFMGAIGAVAVCGAFAKKLRRKILPVGAVILLGVTAISSGLSREEAISKPNEWDENEHTIREVIKYNN